MKKSIIFFPLFAGLCMLTGNVSAQEEWTLQECIEYAIEHNINVQQSALKSEDQEIRLNTAKNSRLPNLSAGLNGNSYFGRGPSRDGTYKDNNQLSASGNLSISIPVFSGFYIKHDIAGRTLDLKAAVQDLARAREDVSLNVTSLYMQVLFNKELLKVAENQVELSKEQLSRSEILYKTGKSSESDVFESKALLAKDELTLTESQNTLALSILDLSQALNMEDGKLIDIKMPKLEEIDVAAMQNMDKPQDIYSYAVGIRPAILAEMFRLESSKKTLLAAKSARYPQITLGGGYNNSLYYAFGVNGNNNQRFGMQLKNNGSESIGLNVSIPIFNRFSTRNQIRSAELNIKSQQLALTDAKRTLYKEIEQSYYNAVTAYDKYVSAMKSVDAARLAFKYAQEKAATGRSTIFDFNDAKTRLERSESEAVQAKFDFVFRRKVLDFYAGYPLEFKEY